MGSLTITGIGVWLSSQLSSTPVVTGYFVEATELLDVHHVAIEWEER
ncbi:hypothetical protein [Cryobacterium sp. Y29]|nr:hypothetical protein [Cryobacterium sp. Y29]